MTTGFAGVFIAWNFFAALAFLGMGRLLTGKVHQQLSPLALSGIGTAAFLIIAGLLALLGQFRPAILMPILVVSGLIGITDFVIRLRAFKTSQLLVFSVGLILISLIGLLRLWVVDASDDEVAYLPLAMDALASGGLNQPLSFRAALSLGGQTLIQALMMLPGGVRFAAGYDWFLCVLPLHLAICSKEFSKTDKLMPVLLASYAMLLVSPAGGWNSAATFIMLIFVGPLIRDAAVLREPGNFVFAALLLAGAASLRTFWAAAAVGVYLAILFPRRELSLGQLAKGVALTGIASILLLLPLFISQVGQFGTISTLLSPGTIFPEYLKYRSGDALLGLLTLFEVSTMPEAFGVLLCCGFAAIALPCARWPLFVLLLCFVAVCFQVTDLDSSYVIRYAKPFLLVAGFTCLLLLIQSEESATFRDGVLIAFAIGAALQATPGLLALSASIKNATTNYPVTAYDFLDHTGRSSKVQELQGKIPKGDTILALNSFPRQLDFSRNRIILGDLPGAVKGLSLTNVDGFLDSCKKLGFQWVILSDPTRDSGYRNENFPHHTHRFFQRKWLPDHKRFIKLNKDIVSEASIGYGEPTFLINLNK